MSGERLRSEVHISRAGLMTFRRLLQATGQEPRLGEAAAIMVRGSRDPSWNGLDPASCSMARSWTSEATFPSPVSP